MVERRAKETGMMDGEAPTVACVGTPGQVAGHSGSVGSVRVVWSAPPITIRAMKALNWRRTSPK